MPYSPTMAFLLARLAQQPRTAPEILQIPEVFPEAPKHGYMRAVAQLKNQGDVVLGDDGKWQATAEARKKVAEWIKNRR